MDHKSLSPEIRQKALECTSVEELVKLAKQEGVELTGEELEAFSGGGNVWSPSDKCMGYAPCSNVCGSATVASMHTATDGLEGPLALI